MGFTRARSSVAEVMHMNGVRVRMCALHGVLPAVVRLPSR